MNKHIIQYIERSRKKKKKLFAVLIDPEKFSAEVVLEADAAGADFIFIGGSRLLAGQFQRCARAIRRLTDLPLVIFPGSSDQVSEKADAILLLSLISGRNPDYLIGEHIRAARKLKRSKLEIIPTGYILVGGGKNISTQSVTRTHAIKSTNTGLVVDTALAGELLGMKLIYLEAGSGARHPLPSEVIKRVRKNVTTPLIAGGGLDSAEKAVALCKAGADVIVVGNAIEKDVKLVRSIAKAIRSVK